MDDPLWCLFQQKYASPRAICNGRPVNYAFPLDKYLKHKKQDQSGNSECDNEGYGDVDSQTYKFVTKVLNQQKKADAAASTHNFQPGKIQQQKCREKWRRRKQRQLPQQRQSNTSM